MRRFFNVTMGSFFSLRGFIKNLEEKKQRRQDDTAISALILTHRMIPQSMKSGFLTNCIQHLYLTSYFRSFAATYTYIYMNKCVGIIFNAFYKPESCKNEMQYALNHKEMAPIAMEKCML